MNILCLIGSHAWKYHIVVRNENGETVSAVSLNNEWARYAIERMQGWRAYPVEVEKFDECRRCSKRVDA